MFEFPAFLLPTDLRKPVHSPSALTEHVSLNLARFLPAARYEHAGLQVIFVFLLGKKVFSGMMKEYKHQNISNQGP